VVLLAEQDMSKSFFSSPLSGWLLGCLLIAAAALRIFGAFNDLWLDEIWSLQSVRNITSPLSVFTGIHLDNNNYLNSLWLYWCGVRGNWPGYRIPSIVAGVGCVILAGMIGRRRNAPAAFFAMFLVAFSYVQILYSSEARGYSEVVFFSFLSFYTLEKYMEHQAWPSALLFSISSILGFAAHLIFLNFYGAAILWSAWRFTKSGLGPRPALKSMLACHTAPTMFLIALYFVDIRRLVVGGGSDFSLSGVYADSLAWALGAPPGPILMFITFLFAAALFLAGLWMLWREKSDALMFFVGVILAFPILLAKLHDSDMLYVRHFIVGMAFFLILFSFVLTALYQRGWPGRLLGVLLLSAYFAVNGWHAISLYKYGRGQYAEAVRFLIQNTKGPHITVGSDHDFRVSQVLRFYIDEATGDKTADYYPMDSWPRKGPEWVIHHKESFEDPSLPRVRFTDSFGNSYEFIKTFQSAPLSGLHWFVYHNQSKGIIKRVAH
jgi:hypothetical protein